MRAETVDRGDIGDGCQVELARDGVQCVDDGRMLDSAGESGEDNEPVSVVLFVSPTAAVALLLLRV